MIVFHDVYKSFGAKHVLQGFSLEVNQGETMVIILPANMSGWSWRA